LSGRIDCGTQGVKDTVSTDRLRGLRIFDITDISKPRNVGNVQTCRGSHTHTVVIDPKDPDNVYVYISGSAGVRSPNELAGCVRLTPDKDSTSALFRIEVIKVPLAHPEQAAIVSSPRIFSGLVAPERHGEAPEDIAANAKAVAEARARGGFIATVMGVERVAPPDFINPRLDSIALIPIPGRDVMVQAWYQGGISVFDWTDAAHPKEIAFFDRGPVDSTRMASGGSWSAYWYNGAIASSEIARGLDIFELVPSGFISQNEIDAAKTVHFDYFNTQGQPRLVWPPSFALARAYVDQLARSNGLASARVAAVRQALRSAEKASGVQRRDALTQIATQLDTDATGSGDAAKVQTLASSVRDLAGVAR
jgi:hypothetical protein